MILAYVFASPLHDIRLQQALPPNLLVYVTALVAFIAVAVPVLWRICRNVITIAHEGGHALVAVLCGRRLQSIRLQVGHVRSHDHEGQAAWPRGRS